MISQTPRFRKPQPTGQRRRSYENPLDARNVWQQIAHANPACLAGSEQRVCAIGLPGPAEAAARRARPMMPAGVSTMMGNLGWLVQAQRNRAVTRLGARPLRKP